MTMTKKEKALMLGEIVLEILEFLSEDGPMTGGDISIPVLRLARFIQDLDVGLVVKYNEDLPNPCWYYENYAGYFARMYSDLFQVIAYDMDTAEKIAEYDAFSDFGSIQEQVDMLLSTMVWCYEEDILEMVYSREDAERFGIDWDSYEYE